MVERTRFAGVFARLQPYRLWVQSAFLFVWLDVFGLRYHGVCAPVFHCYACPLATFACPIGVLANFSALHLIPFMTIGLLVVFGALVGSLFCGWACPFGLLQDLAAKLCRGRPARDPKLSVVSRASRPRIVGWKPATLGCLRHALAKISIPQFELPRWTGHFRFVVLGVTVLAIPYLYGENHPLFVCRVCPAGGVEAALPGVVKQAWTGQQILWPNAIKLSIIGVFLVAILFFKRPWCRVLCPLGVIFSAFNRVSAFFLKVDRSRCTDCKRCHKLCQYNIEPEKSPNDLRCIRCLECTRCPFGALAPHTILERPREGPASLEGGVAESR
jgi:polyferredoxin